MPLKEDCLFCKIIQGKIPSKKILENEHVFAFQDIQPQAPHHILVIPKFHVESLAHLKGAEFDVMSEMYKAAQEIATHLKFKDSGFRSVINTGEHGGQTVFHLHLHLLAGTQMSGKFG